MPAGLARLEVRFRVDADGLLHVSATERTTGLAQEVEVKPSYGLDDAAIERMLLEAYEHGEADIARRALLEQRVEAERVLHAIEKAMGEDSELLLERESIEITAAMKRLHDASQSDDARAIAARIEELDDATRDFAGRRMDRAIKSALRGRDLTGLEEQTASAKGIDSHLPQAAREDD